MPVKTQRWNQWMLSSTKFGDLALAGLVILVICLMIVPIPTWLLDTLLALNLTISVSLLMIALYVPGVLKFSTFPSILLFTTLFRLALNITTTRLILLHAYAGEIVETFGTFVVAGNFAVGAVIFLIILIVQFVVITKGAERVAEVSARFTLDAMPGKQMSIDADMRAGTIDVEEGRQRRAELEKENQLYGAMDGAMKFVKGDAIAGLIITCINILAGFAIGVFQRGMSFGDAVHTYSILTIGDGLVSQIPALLISITAGVIVTRVASEDDLPLGKEMFGQLLGQPMALIIGAGMLFGAALIPGFPAIQFIILALFLLGMGISIWKVQKQDAEKVLAQKKSGLAAFQPATGKGEEATVSETDEEQEFSVTVPLMLDVSHRLQDSIDPNQLNEELVEVRRALYHDLGVPFPGIHLRFSANLEDNQYAILIQEVPVSEGTLPSGCVLVRESIENLQLNQTEGESADSMVPGIKTCWVKETEISKLEKAGIAYMRPPKVVTFHLSYVLKRYAHEFIGIQETRFLLDKLGESNPNLIRELERILPVQTIAEIFQRMVQEGISIRNLKLLSQSLIEWGQREKDTLLLSEYCRSNLRRWISYKYSGGRNILPVYVLEPDLEETIRKAIRQTSSGSYLALEPEISQKILAKIKEEVGEVPAIGPRPVLVTAMDTRRYLRKLIEMELYELPVLSYQELTEEITLQPLARIGI